MIAIGSCWEKGGTYYVVDGMATNCTSKDVGQPLVLYHESNRLRTFAHDRGEFLDNFREVPNEL